MTETTSKAVDQLDGSISVVDTNVRLGLESLIAAMDEHTQKLNEAAVRYAANVLEKKALCALLPAALPLVPSDIRVSDLVYRADAELVFKDVSRTQALELLSVMPGVPLLFVQCGTATYVPDERFVPSAHGNDKVQPIGEMAYRLDTWISQLREEYFWWTRLGDKLVRIVAYSGKDSGTAKATSRSRMLDHDMRETTWTYENLPKGKLVKWHGGSSSNVVPLSVHMPRDSVSSVTFSEVMVATATVVKDRCGC